MDRITKVAVADAAIAAANEARRTLAELRQEGSEDSGAWACALRHARRQLALAAHEVRALQIATAEEEREAAWNAALRARKAA